MYVCDYTPNQQYVYMVSKKKELENSKLKNYYTILYSYNIRTRNIKQLPECTF